MKILTSVFFLFSMFVFGQKNYPIPEKTNNLLFYIQHSSNHNTFVYEYNPTSNTNPIKIYRINYEGKGEKNPLTAIQKKFAYGVVYSDHKNDQFMLVAKRDIPFTIKSSNNKYLVEIKLKNQIIIVDHIFLQIVKGTSGLKTKIDYMIIYGKNDKGKNIEEKIIP